MSKTTDELDGWILPCRSYTHPKKIPRVFFSETRRENIYNLKR